MSISPVTEAPDQLLELLAAYFADPGPLAWQDDALCGEVDGDLFFPEKGGDVKKAKEVCMACRVRTECLEYALAHNERFGIWGAKSERQRRVILASRRIEAA